MKDEYAGVKIVSKNRVEVTSAKKQIAEMKRMKEVVDNEMTRMKQKIEDLVKQHAEEVSRLKAELGDAGERPDSRKENEMQSQLSELQETIKEKNAKFIE